MIQRSLQYENFTKYYLCKGIFLYIFLYPERYYQAKSAELSKNHNKSMKKWSEMG